MNELNEEMHNYRDGVVNKLKNIVHPLYVEEFAKVLHYSWLENLPEAESIADKLDFNKIDFAALTLDEKEFKNLFLKELQRYAGC